MKCMKKNLATLFIVHFYHFISLMTSLIRQVNRDSREELILYPLVSHPLNHCSFTCWARLCLSCPPHFICCQWEDGHRVASLHLPHHWVLTHSAQQLHAIYGWNKAWFDINVNCLRPPCGLAGELTTYIFPGWDWRPCFHIAPAVWTSVDR